MRDEVFGRDRYNCLRERSYDGSHLQLPGMNSSVTLRPHQKELRYNIIYINHLWAHYRL